MILNTEIAILCFNIKQVRGLMNIVKSKIRNNSPIRVHIMQREMVHKLLQSLPEATESFPNFAAQSFTWKIYSYN